MKNLNKIIIGFGLFLNVAVCQAVKDGKPSSPSIFRGACQTVRTLREAAAGDGAAHVRLSSFRLLKNQALWKLCDCVISKDQHDDFRGEIEACVEENDLVAIISRLDTLLGDQE